MTKLDLLTAIGSYFVKYFEMHFKNEKPSLPDKKLDTFYKQIQSQQKPKEACLESATFVNRLVEAIH